ncbi:hypothetical protein LMIY3S_01317 [Labrys miyagiensis]
MLFTGFIAALIARFYDPQAQRLRNRRHPSMRSRNRDDDGSGADQSGPLTRKY